MKMVYLSLVIGAASQAFAGGSDSMLDRLKTGIQTIAEQLRTAMESAKENPSTGEKGALGEKGTLKEKVDSLKRRLQSLSAEQQAAINAQADEIKQQAGYQNPAEIRQKVTALAGKVQDFIANLSPTQKEEIRQRLESIKEDASRL